eukprot:TRINITY_DN63186_c0_g1_i1.p1 TRINITY_DN63186_c0_g1~~TRINITY_DN63186_c0_g1_i1.p1  ORF type:complete len:104 (-),score=12.90 TRINITY_DN63186_c0_g1_i1:41-352(-)
MIIMNRRLLKPIPGPGCDEVVLHKSVTSRHSLATLAPHHTMVYLHVTPQLALSLIHISEPTRLLSISYAVFCLKKKKNILIHNYAIYGFKRKKKQEMIMWLHV